MICYAKMLKACGMDVYDHTGSLGGIIPPSQFYIATDKQEATDPSTDVDLDEACDLESWVRRLRFDDGSGPGGGGAAGGDALVA